jgi:hypothetical protein
VFRGIIPPVGGIDLSVSGCCGVVLPTCKPATKLVVVQLRTCVARCVCA